MVANNIAVVPFFHPDLERLRNNKLGVQFHQTKTNFLVFSAEDDVWVNEMK